MHRIPWSGSLWRCARASTRGKMLRALRRLPLIALAAWCFACGDGVVGRDSCAGELDCQARQVDAGDVLMVDFETIDDPAFMPLPMELPPTPLACGSERCETPTRLVHAGEDSVWTSPRADGRLSIGWVDRAWTRHDEGPLEPPPGARAKPPTFMTGDEGRAVLRFDWPAAGGSEEPPLVSELVVVARESGVIERVPLQRGFELESLIAMPSGFLLFNGGPYGASSLVLVDRDGMNIWRRSSFRFGARIVGGSAVAFSGGFVIGAHSGVSNKPSFGLLWLDASGAPTRYALPADSSWKTVSLLTLEDGGYALAASSELLGAVNETAQDGNLEIVRFDGTRPARGVRIIRNCYYDLTVNGFTSDKAGNLYVSSVAGENGEPRGVLCQISPSLDWRCYQTEPQVELGDIAAIGERTLFVVANREIVRVVLPE